MYERADSRICFRIGDIGFELASADSSLKVGAEGPALAFVVDGGDSDVRLTAAWSGAVGPPPGPVLFDADSVWTLYRGGAGYEFRFSAPFHPSGPYKIARFNEDLTSGEILLSPACYPQYDPIYALEYPLDELLMVNLLARGRGVEVHGCGLRDADGRGYLFLGMSGAGKSTTAGLWRGPGVEILSDDRIILRRLDGRLWMYGTPWHGEAELACPLRAPVDRILFLARGAANKLVPLRPPEAVARMMACSFVPFFDSEGLGFTLEFLQYVAEAAACAEFQFVPDRHAVDFVRKIGG
jgi:hypothetical protein